MEHDTSGPYAATRAAAQVQQVLEAQQECEWSCDQYAAWTRFDCPKVPEAALAKLRRLQSWWEDRVMVETHSGRCVTVTVFKNHTTTKEWERLAMPHVTSLFVCVLVAVLLWLLFSGALEMQIHAVLPWPSRRH